MQILNITEVRKNLARLVEAAVEEDDPTIIVRPGGKNAVIVSHETFSSLTETLHVLGTRQNARRLLDSLDQLDRGEFVTMTEPEADEKGNGRDAA